MDSTVNKFYELQKQNKKRKFVKPQVLQNLELIQRLVKEGNSLKQIHEFLLGENLVKCDYSYFIKVFYSVKNEKTREDKSTVTDNIKSAVLEEQQSNKSNEKKESNEVVSNNTEIKSQSKTVDVSFKPITSLDDGITEEEMKELMEQQKRILNRRN